VKLVHFEEKTQYNAVLCDQWILKEANMTQEQLAEKAGTKESYIFTA